MRTTSRAPSDTGAYFRSTRFGDRSAECVMSWWVVRFLRDNRTCSALCWFELDAKSKVYLFRLHSYESKFVRNWQWHLRYSADTHYWIAWNQSWPSGKGCEAKLVRPKKEQHLIITFPWMAVRAWMPSLLLIRYRVHCPLISGVERKIGWIESKLAFALRCAYWRLCIISRDHCLDGRK